MELAQAAKECEVAAIRRADIALPPASGCGAGGRHLTLLVRDERGWSNLCRIITLAHAHTRDGPQQTDGRMDGLSVCRSVDDGPVATARSWRPGRDGQVATARWRLSGRDGQVATASSSATARSRVLGEPAVELEAVLDHAEGLVCRTGCADRSAICGAAMGRPGRDGPVATAPSWRPGRGGILDEPTARHLLDAFGTEGLRVELQRPYARHDRARNRALAGLARRLGVACVATGNVHAHTRSRAELQDAFVALRNHATLEASEPLRRGNHSHVMCTPQAMASRFADHPEAVAETLRLAEQLTFDLTEDLGYRYPGAEDAQASRRLSELCGARLQERYAPGAAGVRTQARAEAQARLAQELEVIDKLGLAGFFLLHHDMLELSREVALEVRGRDSVRGLLSPGRGRGSSVSSLVCYLIGLSPVDPIANDLALGRFLHEDLRGLPDIDLDFPRDVRETLIPRVHERYGRDRAALVAAFPTFRARGAIRELGKVLGLPAAALERLARGADAHHPAERRPASERSALGGAAPADTAARTSSPRWRWLERLVGEAYGLPRHLPHPPVAT